MDLLDSLWFAGVQMPAGGNVIKRTHPGFGVFAVWNMDDRERPDETRRDKGGKIRTKKEEREMKEGGCSTSRWTTTTTLVVACGRVIGCNELMMREGPARLSLGTPAYLSVFL